MRRDGNTHTHTQMHNLLKKQKKRESISLSSLPQKAEQVTEDLHIVRVVLVLVLDLLLDLVVVFVLALVSHLQLSRGATEVHFIFKFQGLCN